jgi:metal-dependent amidase/aminoacylase/carboxypeptidase family protein
MIPTLEATAGKENVSITPAVTGAEDFSYYQEKIPGLYFFLGGAPKANQYQRPRRIIHLILHR